ncbi:hypothetical protein [Acaryochloris marina]|uniref:hypothetical protein n=1 Tax=Acaryochloris marina TaxID=155978 RepID=UPI0021C27D0C|nr:hypothetical protein [Acaryochloris marina]BDM78138.1 hypothetical protein AM10699_10080 [Acaryochloris marina MBIC10699]
MYSQFRSQYPTGSLTSELLKAEPDHYIVRALIQVGGTTLATGLSSASTVEEAEDHARARALVVLGIEAATFETQAHLMGEQDQARLQPASLSEDLQAIANRALDAVPEWDDPSLQMQDMPAPDFVEEEAPPRRGASRRQKPKATTAKRKASRSSSVDTAALDSPLDLSDIIAQTDVELKRLGWTSTQGRQHLQQTYNKRSRQHLTDQELLEFLDFLQSQANIDEAPF